MIDAPNGPSTPRSGTAAALETVERTALVLDCLPRAIVIWDVHGTVVAWNHNSELLFGWSAESVIGRHIGDVLIFPAEYPSIREIGIGVESGVDWSGDITIVRSDGTPARIHSILLPLRAEDGTIVGSVGVSDDVTHQRMVEERAAELTNHLLMALAGGELGTWRRDLDTGLVVWDAAMERLCGVEHGTYDGTEASWYEIVHPDDRARVAETIAAAVTERSSYQVEYRVVHPDGAVRWLQTRAMVTFHPDGTVSGTIGCSGDTTDRKEAELEAERRAAEAERLVEEGELQRGRLEFLARLNDAALAARDHRELMREVTATAVPTLGDWCSLHFFENTAASSFSNPEIIVAHADPDRLEWLHSLLVQHPYNPDAPIGAAKAIREGVTQFVPTFAGEVRERIIAEAVRATPEQARAILDLLRPTSLIAVPLVTRRGVIGAMQFVSAESGRLYDDADVALAETAAGRVAEALDGAWLRDQQRNVATVLQSALLPSELPEIDGVSVAVRYWAAGAASEVGGDFYDIFPIDAGPGAVGDRWAIVIGDVCGTGPEAAAVTAIARHTIRAAATHGASPTEVLEWLNDAIRASDRDRFCTVLYSTLERVEGSRWRYTSVAGGHPLPFAVAGGTEAGAGAAVPLGRAGTLLGVLPELRLTVNEVMLDVGDTVVLNTDGITDVPDPYGIDDAAMEALVAEAASVPGPAERVAERLGAAVQRVLPIPEREDDIALVVVRIVGDGLVDLRSGAVAAGEDAPIVIEREFAADTGAVSAAREFVVSSVGHPSMEEALRLAVSELATNAVMHARSSFRVRVMTTSGHVRVEIDDRSERLPVSRGRRHDHITGRGMGIVEHLSSRWGVTPIDGGKSVWFELRA